MIPLLVFLTIQGEDRKMSLSIHNSKKIILFLIPVIMIPLIWPSYAFVSGDLDKWFDGVIWQATNRQSEDKTLFEVTMSFLRVDPLILILGTIGIIYLTVRREFIGIIWIVPYFLLLYLVGWVNHFHLILVIPIWCISFAKLIYDSPYIIRAKRKETIISSVIVAAIVLFGTISTSMLISTDLSYIQLRTASYIINQVIPKIGGSKSGISDNEKEQITIVAGPIYSWIYKYVLDHPHTFSHIRDTQPIRTDKVILLVDPMYKRLISRSEAENQTQLIRLSSIYNNTDLAAVFSKLPSNYTKKQYPFTGIDSADSGLSTNEIRKNY
jgi:hypothetical protein